MGVAFDIKAQILFQISEITLLKAQYWEYNRVTKIYISSDKKRVCLLSSEMSKLKLKVGQAGWVVVAPGLYWRSPRPGMQNCPSSWYLLRPWADISWLLSSMSVV